MFDSLDHILGTRNKVRLLRCLFTLDRAVSGREACRLAGVSSIGQRSLDELVDVGIATRTEGTAQHWYAAHRGHPLASPLEALFKREAAALDQLLDTLRGGFDRIEAIMAAYVFGSFARGENRPDSDLDLLVILTGEVETATQVRQKLHALGEVVAASNGMRPSFTVLSASQLEARHASGDRFAREAVRDARWIWGEGVVESLRREGEES
jgi:predicted nucleotidyltransferase